MHYTTILPENVGQPFLLYDYLINLNNNKGPFLTPYLEKENDLKFLQNSCNFACIVLLNYYCLCQIYMYKFIFVCGLDKNE